MSQMDPQARRLSNRILDKIQFPNRRRKALGAALAIVAFSVATTAQPISASAATAPIAGNASVVVDGSSVSSTTTITASRGGWFDHAGVCVRDSSWNNVDFPKENDLWISGRTTTVSASESFAPGTYYYWTCAKQNGGWNVATQYKTFTVSKKSIGTGGSSGSGQPMPVGNLPGWTQTFTEDFKTPVARGGFPGPYAGKWMSYNGFPDGTNTGRYDSSIISVHDGVLDMNLHTRDGVARGAAPVPLVNGQWGGQLYGRFSVRMKSDSLPGYGPAFLLWNDSGNFDDGEVDFPESDLSENSKGYNHCVGNAKANCLVVDTGFSYTDWHTYTINWTPTRVNLELDGKSVGSSTSVPYRPLHWVMQVATRGLVPDPSINGHMLIDWATVYKYTP